LRAVLPVLRGFSRNVKQDSEANAVSGGMRQSRMLAPGACSKLREEANNRPQVPMRDYPHLRSKWLEGAMRPVPNGCEGKLPGFSRLELTGPGKNGVVAE
jgi:hypothetical protein